MTVTVVIQFTVTASGAIEMFRLWKGVSVFMGYGSPRNCAKRSVTWTKQCPHKSLVLVPPIEFACKLIKQNTDRSVLHECHEAKTCQFSFLPLKVSVSQHKAWSPNEDYDINSFFLEKKNTHNLSRTWKFFLSAWLLEFYIILILLCLFLSADS